MRASKERSREIEMPVDPGPKAAYKDRQRYFKEAGRIVKFKPSGGTPNHNPLQRLKKHFKLKSRSEASRMVSNQDPRLKELTQRQLEWIGLRIT